jgi:hypothetical protein
MPTIWLLTASVASMSSSVSFDGRSPVRPARPRSGKARLDAFTNQAALEFRPTRQTYEKQPDLARSSCRRLRSGCKNRCLSPAGSRWFRSTGFIERAKRSSFHTTSVSPLRANSNASRKAGRSDSPLDNCSMKILPHPAARQDSGEFLTGVCSRNLINCPS